MTKILRSTHQLFLMGLMWLGAYSLSAAQSITNQNTSQTYPTIQNAIDAASDNDVIVLSAGTFDELAVISKPLTIKGQGSSSVVTFTGTLPSGATPTQFKVTSPNVTISDLTFTVNMSKLVSAIHTSGTCTNLAVLRNTITPTGTPSGSYGTRNAIAINPIVNLTGYSLNTNGFGGIVVKGNTVNANAAGITSSFRSAVCTDLCGGVIGGSSAADGNTLTSINHDVFVRFANQGDVTIQNNTSKGGGIQVAEFNGGAGTITIANNSLTGATVQPDAGALGTGALLRLQNNSNGKTVNVNSNTFSDYRWAASVENFNNITFNNNTFTPRSGSTDYRSISFNTKLLASSSATVTPIAIGATLTSNIFNGSGAAGGTAIAFFNHRQDGSTPSIGTYTLGTPGNENTFNAGIATFLRLDNSTGPSSGFMSPFNEYAVSGAPSTTMAKWTPDLNAINNKFDVGSGAKLAQNLTATERTTLAGKLFDKNDDAGVGLITFFLPVRNVTQNTSAATIQAAIDAANAGDVIELAEYTFNERATITKSLTLQGVSKTGTIIDGTGLGNGNGITLADNVSNITVKNLTIQKQAGSPNGTGNGIYGKTNNNLTITDVVAINNGVHGIILETSGNITNVSVTNSTLSNNGPTAQGRGLIIFNNLKSNITVSNNTVKDNGLAGIDINEGTVAGLTISNNTVSGNGDAGISVLGAKSDGGANLVATNNVTDNGRFGIEVKSSIGNGSRSGNGSLVIENNTVNRTTSFSPSASAARDLAGIAVIRRAAGVSISSPETPAGYIVTGNSVSGFVNPGAGDGFGIVVEGVNYLVTNNNARNNEVGIQEQQTLPNERGRPGGDSPQGDETDYFDRGNSYAACGVVSNNNTANNSIAATRRVGPAAFSVTASANPTAVCAGQTVALSSQISNGSSPFTYKWTAPAGASVSPDNAMNATGTVSTAGVKSFSVTATDTYGCVASSSVNVTGKNSAVITEQPAASSAVCAGTTVKVGVVATNATGYKWFKNGNQLTDGGSVSGATTAMLTITNAQAGDAGTYYAVVTGDCGDVTSSNFVLTVNPLPQPSLNNNGPLSLNKPTVTLTADGGSVGAPFTYKFSTGATQQGNGNTATVTSSGVYTVTVTSGQGCQAVASTTVQGANNPTVCRGGSATVDLTAAGSPIRYEWYQNAPIGNPLQESSFFKGTGTASLTAINVQANITLYAKVYYANGSTAAYGPFRIAVNLNCSGRVSANEEPGSQLNVRLLGNPVVGDEVRVEVRGAESQRLMLRLVDTQGRVISGQDVSSAESVEAHRLRIGRQAGVYLLQVSTPAQHQTLRILKTN